MFRPEILGDATADMILFGVGLVCWVVLFTIIYSPRERGIWWLEALVRAIVGSVLGAIVAGLLGWRANTATIAAWLAGGVAVAISRPRS